MQAGRNAVRQTGRLTGSEEDRQTDSCTDRQTNRQAGGQEVRQTDTQTRVPINMGLVDGND